MGFSCFGFGLARASEAATRTPGSLTRGREASLIVSVGCEIKPWGILLKLGLVLWSEASGCRSSEGLELAVQVELADLL